MVHTFPTPAVPGAGGGVQRVETCLLTHTDFTEGFVHESKVPRNTHMSVYKSLPFRVDPRGRGLNVARNGTIVDRICGHSNTRIIGRLPISPTKVVSNRSENVSATRQRKSTGERYRYPVSAHRPNWMKRPKHVTPPACRVSSPSGGSTGIRKALVDSESPPDTIRGRWLHTLCRRVKPVPGFCLRTPTCACVKWSLECGPRQELRS